MQSENTVIGAMLSDPLAISDAIAKLTPADFVLESNQRIFSTIRGMVDSLTAVDLITVSMELHKRGELDSIGGSAYLSDLSNGVPRNCAIGEHVQAIQNASLGRRGYNLCQETQQRLLDPAEDAKTVLDDLSRLLTVERPEDSILVSEAMPLAMAYLEDGGGTVIPTGIPDLDDILGGGIRTKQFTVIGAQPSGGKSALCRQIERSAVQHGYGIHAHSIEVPKEVWLLHHAAHLAGVEPWKLREKKYLTPTEHGYLRSYSRKMAEEWNYIIDDAGSVSINTLIAKSRLSAMRHRCKLYTVDYLQLLGGDDKVPMHRQMSQVAMKLKQFAKDYDVAVVALSQLARKGDINHRPTVQDLKESGDIEAAANVVLLNYRPKDSETDDYTGEDEIIVGKQRDGKVGKIPMFFDWKNLQFRGRLDGGTY